MQAIESKRKYSFRSGPAGVWAPLLAVSTICLCAAVVAAQSKPAIMVSQASLMSDFSTGGFTCGGDTAGGSFAVTQGGDVAVGTTYGNILDLVNGVTGKITTLPAPWAIGVTIDRQNNLYAGQEYGTSIYKFPYINGSYVTTMGSAPCTGNDQTVCTIPDPGTPIKAMAFDASDDLFMVTQTNGTSGGNGIYELTAANLYTGTPAQVYTDANPVSSIALDPWGNLFYTDAVFTDGSSQTEATSSSLNELVSTGTGSTGYATTPTVLVTYTNASPSAYDDVLSGVAVDTNGTVYYADQHDGIYAFPNTPANRAAVADAYQVSTQGAYQIALDSKGNLFATNYDSANSVSAVYRVSLNNLVVPQSPVGTAATTTTDVLVNDGPCSPTLTATAASNGQTTTEFGATFGTCTAQMAGLGNGSVFTGTFTFTPTSVGERDAVLAVTDTTNGGTGTVTVSGFGQGALLTLDPGASTPYTTGFTTPASVAVDGLGNLAVADAGANAVFEIVAGSSTPARIGTGFKAPGGTAFDAAGNLYIADSGNNRIIEIPNIAGVLAPASQTTIVDSTVAFAGTMLNSPQGLAIGPDGALYISDTGNNRVVTYDGGWTGVRLSGLTAPAAGISVDSSGNLYIAIPSQGEVLVYAGGTLAATLSSGLTTPEGVAVDPSGSVLIADPGIPGIVRVPNVAGTLTAQNQAVIENLSAAPGAIAIDAAGDLFVTDATAKAVYAVSRAQASVNFGNVISGQSSPEVPIYVESSGNLALNTPAIAASVAAPFTLQAAATDPCGSGVTTNTVAAGTLCEFAAQFSPDASDAGPYNATSSLTLTGVPVATSPASSANITLSGDATKTVGGSQAQSITFPPPATPITYSATPITLYAVASPSGLPITFTVTGPAAITGTTLAPTLTLSGFGTVVVTASQAGNATYAAAAPISQTIVVNAAGTVATPTFSLAAGTYTFAPQIVSITDSTPGSVIYYTADGSRPTTSSNVYSGPISVTATETIQALAAATGYNTSAVFSSTYTINVQPAAFSLAFNSPTLAIPSQQAGAIDVTVTPTNGFTGTVTLSVTGLPSNAASSFTPPTLALSGGNSNTSVLTVSLSPSAVLRRDSSPLFPGATLALALCFFGWRKRRGIMQLLMLLTIGAVSLGLLTGCGSSPKPTSSIVTVTATSGSVVESATFSLIVTPN